MAVVSPTAGGQRPGNGQRWRGPGVACPKSRCLGCNPAALAAESSPAALPGFPAGGGPCGAGLQAGEDGVADLPLERAQRLFGGLALGQFLVVAGAVVAVPVADLGDRGHVDGVAVPAVPASARRQVLRGRRTPRSARCRCRQRSGPGREARHVADVADDGGGDGACSGQPGQAGAGGLDRDGQLLWSRIRAPVRRRSPVKAAAGTPDFRTVWRSRLFEPRHGEAPASASLKPGQSAGRWFESQPAGTSQRYDLTHCHPARTAPSTRSLNQAVCARLSTRGQSRTVNSLTI